MSLGRVCLQPSGPWQSIISPLSSSSKIHSQQVPSLRQQCLAGAILHSVRVEAVHASGAGGGCDLSSGITGSFHASAIPGKLLCRVLLAYMVLGESFLFPFSVWNQAHVALKWGVCGRNRIHDEQEAQPVVPQHVFIIHPSVSCQRTFSRREDS